MITILNISDTKFSYNGIAYFKNFTPFVTGNKISIVNAYDSCLSLTNFPTNYTDISVNGVTYGSVAALQDALLGVLYTRNSLTNAIIALTTTGNSGAATLVGTTLNIPNYTLAGLGGIGGTLSTGFIPKATGSGTLGNSLIYDNGTNVGIGTTSPPLKNSIQASTSGGNNSVTPLISLQDDRSDRYSSINVVRGAGSYDIGMSFSTVYETGGSASITERFRINPNGNVGIGTTSPSAKTAIHKSELGSNPSAVLRLENTGANYTSKLILTDGTTNDANISYLGVTQSLGFGIGSSLNQMVLTSTGNVGIGTTSPSEKLHVVGKGYFVPIIIPAVISGISSPYYGTNITLGSDLGANQGAARMWSRYDGSGRASITFETNTSTQSYGSDTQLLSYTETMRITGSGNVGIGTTSPSFQLQLSNDSAAKPGSPLWTVSSDIRIKENVRPYTDGLEKLMQVNPVYYDYNGKAGFSITKDNVGIIAQEMQEVLPNTIKTFKAKLNDDDEEETELLSFNANEIIYVLINSVKELKAEIQILKN